jgi:biopolymer transport protein ExbD
VAQSFIKNKVLYSTLASHSNLQPGQGRRAKRNLSSTLLLTSLVDAFSILVIFLMMNSATDQSDFETDKSVQLPRASQSEISMKTAMVQMTRSGFHIEGRSVHSDNLAPALVALHQKLTKEKNPLANSLIIVADRDEEFATLNPIIIAGSRAGFSEFRFAVERGLKSPAK